MDKLLAALIGLALGGVVNVLADDLPAGRWPRLPRYPGGRRRPLLAWLGVTAFAFGLRQAPDTQSEDSRTDRAQRRRLNWRYPLVELALSALTPLTDAISIDNQALSLEETLIWQTLVVLFVLIAIIDLEHKRIHSASLLATSALAIIRLLALQQSPPTGAAMLLGAFCAGLVFSLVFLGGRLFSRWAPKRWDLPADVTVFGRGDVYLMAVGGLIVGFPAILAAMALTILLGGIGGIAYLATARAAGGCQRFIALPYAPYILTSTYIVMLLRGEISRLLFGM